MKEQFYIFLDFAGVLTNFSYSTPEEERDSRVQNDICPWSVEALNLLIDKLEENYETRLVFASTLRIRPDNMTKCFFGMHKAGVREEQLQYMVENVIHNDGHRGREIEEFIVNNKVKNFVVIDDNYLPIMENIDEKYIIKTEAYHKGLTEGHVEEFLNREHMNKSEFIK